MKYQCMLNDPSFRVGNIDVQSVSRPKDYKHSFKNGREKHGFVYIVSGKMLDSFQDKRLEDICAQKGDMIFIPRKCIYSGTYLEENTTIKIVQFDIISGELPEYLSEPKKIQLSSACELVESFFRPMNEHIPYHPFYYLSRLYELLWRIDESESYVRVPAKYKKLQSAVAELRSDFFENKKVSYYAELCGMSETNFRRTFHEYMGMSPIEYRNDMRLANAKNKLQSGEYNVSEAAYESGFSNLSFFIRLYRKKYGYTPKNE